jgi:hypothetical protein
MRLRAGKWRRRARARLPAECSGALSWGAVGTVHPFPRPLARVTRATARVSPPKEDGAWSLARVGPLRARAATAPLPAETGTAATSRTSLSPTTLVSSPTSRPIKSAYAPHSIVGARCSALQRRRGDAEERQWRMPEGRVAPLAGVDRRGAGGGQREGDAEQHRGHGRTEKMQPERWRQRQGCTSATS